MQQTPSSEASTSSAGLFPAFYATWRFITIFKGPITGTMLSHINPINILPPCFFNVYFNTILTSLPGSLVSFLQVFPPNPVHICLISHACHTSCTSHPPWFEHIIKVIKVISVEWVHIITFLITQLSPAPCQVQLTFSSLVCSEDMRFSEGWGFRLWSTGLWCHALW